VEAGIPMTNYGPPQGVPRPPPEPPRPGYPPPTVYGPPTAYPQWPGYGPAAGDGQAAVCARRPAPSFGPVLVNPLDWVTIGAGFLAFVFSFFAYYSYIATAAETRGECANRSGIPDEARGVLSDLCGGSTAGAWHGFFGWFGVLLGLVAAGLVAVAVVRPQQSKPSTARLVAVGAGVLGVLSTLIAFPVVPNWPEGEDFIHASGGSLSRAAYNSSVSEGHGFSYWVVLAMLLVLTVVTFVRFQQTGRSLSASPGGFSPGDRAGYGAPSVNGVPQAPPPGGWDWPQPPPPLPMPPGAPPGQWQGPP
jgi:hypothetical protein